MSTTLERHTSQPAGNTDHVAQREAIESAAAIGHQPLAKVGRRAIQRHFKKIRKRQHHLDEGDAGEQVHKLRVSTRALRATLELLEEAPVFDAPTLKMLRQRLKRLTGALGEVRDLDVFLGRVTAFEREHPASSEGLQPLRDTLIARRETANAHLHQELHRGRTKRLIRDLRRLARDPSRAEESGEWPALLVRQFAGGAIWRRYEAVLAFEGLMPDATIEQLHALRIACKHLRYVIELFDAAHEAEKHPMLALLQSAQDYLGKLHDDAVALVTVDEVRAAHPDATALFTFAETVTGERDSLCRGVAPLWDGLTGDATRRQLATFIAAL